MIEYYATGARGELTRLDEEAPGCWIAAFEPEPHEVADLAARYGLDEDDVRLALDPDEVSRVEDEHGYTMVVMDTPIPDQSAHEFGYRTIPFALFETGKNVITVCSRADVPLMREMAAARALPLTSETDLFTVRVLTASSAAYLAALRVINRARKTLTVQSERPTRRQLEDLYVLDESLVYFKTSLATNDNVFEKRLRMTRGQEASLREGFEDVVFENRQAFETTKIFSEMLDSAIDHFGLLMDHDLNRTMQVMTVVTLLVDIPAAVAGLFGMNVGGIPFEGSPYGFAVVTTATLALSALIMIRLRRRRWF